MFSRASPSAKYRGSKSFSSILASSGDSSLKFIAYATSFDSFYLPADSYKILFCYFNPWHYKFADSLGTIFNILIFLLANSLLICFHKKNLG